MKIKVYMGYNNAICCAKLLFEKKNNMQLRLVYIYTTFRIFYNFIFLKDHVRFYLCGRYV